MLWWVLLYINMNGPQLCMCSPILKYPSTILPNLYLWVIPKHQLWHPASFIKLALHIFQFSSVAYSCLTLCNPMDCNMLGFPVHHQLLVLAQTYVHWVGDAIQPSHPLSSPSPPTFSLSQHQGLFQWVSSLHQVAKVLEFQLQHQFFQWIFRTDYAWLVGSSHPVHHQSWWYLKNILRILLLYHLP